MKPTEPESDDKVEPEAPKEKKALFKDRKKSQNASQNSNLNLEEGISRGMKKTKIENFGLGTRRTLPDSKLLVAKSSQNSKITDAIKNT